MTRDDTGSTDETAFAHASEAELARILDFYEVRWQYEPRTFPILWNLDGDVVESFSPDFYLPELDMYVELTTLKQKLVRKKNRKLRRLRELYPDVRIKLFYARDFRMLMLKFGRLALLDAFTGTTGQRPPVRAADTIGATVVATDASVLDHVSMPEPIVVQPRLEIDSPAGAFTPRGRRRGKRRSKAVVDAATEA